MYQENPIEQAGAALLLMAVGATLLLAMQKYGEFKRNQALREVRDAGVTTEGKTS